MDILEKIKGILECFYFSYIVWCKKGYQEFQEPRGTSVIKVKGIAKVTGNDTVRYIRMLRKRNFLLKIKVSII